MRIVYLHQYFATPDMAGGTRSYEMGRRLVAAGHEVHMVTTRQDGEGRGWTETAEAGMHVHWCSVPYSNHMSFRRRIKAFLDFAWRAARRTAQIPCDVVFATSTPLTIALPAAYGAWRQSMPMVFEVRDLWPEAPIVMGALRRRLPIALARGLERFAYNRAAHVVALSPEMKDGVVAAGYPDACVSVIPNSCDLELFDISPEAGTAFRRRHAWLQDRPLVVYSGALGRFNGVDYLARLAAVVGQYNPEVRFLVIGDGSERAKIAQVASELNVLDRNFFLLDSVPKKSMPAVLSAADIATSTVINRRPLWAYSPNKIFDALAAGRPVAVNHEGWLADMIRQSGCGLVLPASDIRQGAQQLVAMLGDPVRLSQAREAARRGARHRFDRDMLAARLEAVIRAAAEKRGSRVTAADVESPAAIPIGTAAAAAAEERRKAA